MGIVVAAVYAVLAVVLIAGGVALVAQQSMEGVPLYDPETATNPSALARVLGLSLVAFGAVTLTFASVEAIDRTNVVAVAVYGFAVLGIAVLTAARTRKYE